MKSARHPATALAPSLGRKTAIPSMCRSMQISRIKRASVVRHTDRHLFRAARPRFTFSKMSQALAVQMKGLGSRLCCLM